ncbi:MAG: Ig-like domain repeat protein [Acidobacteriaceae bacterium]|nr:Ig-like domain repeat protein [Acidobacteriaceae bacterium]
MLPSLLPFGNFLSRSRFLALFGSVLFSVVMPAQTINLTSSSQLALNLGPSASPVSLSGGSGPFTVSVLSGSLPPGISLRSSGFPAGWNATVSPFCLCGVGTVPGRFNFTLRIASGSSRLDQDYTVDVASAVDPNPPTLPDALTNAPYSHQLRSASAAASPSYFWSVAPGSSLPAGLTLSSSGLISGTAGAPGTFSFFTTLADGGFGTSRVQHTITIRPFALTSPSTLPAATQNVAYNHTLTTGSGSTGALSFNVLFGSLPTGLSLNNSTGVISGTPSEPGSYYFAIQARDANFGIAQRTFALQVVATPPGLLSYTGEPFTRLADLTIGTYRAHEMSAGSGVAPYTFSLRAGSQLPPGMSFLTGSSRPNAISSNDFQAVLAGAPTVLGTYTFTIDVTDSSTPPVTTSKTYTINIASLSTVTNPPAANQGAAYSFTMQPLGGSGSYTLSYPVGYQPNVFTGRVRLPNGLSLNTVTRTISGTPTESGTFYVPFEISDGATTLRQVLTLVVNSVSPLTFCANSLFPSATVARPYSFQPCLGGSSPYAVNILSGSLPAGLSFTTTGALTGLPTVPGLYNFLTRFVDSSSPPRSVTAYVTISVQNMFPNLSSQLPPATVGTNYSQPVGIGGADASLQISVEPDSVLPSGLTLNAGVLAGVPSVAGLHNFNLRFTSTQGSGGFYVQPFTLAVTSPSANGTTTIPFALSRVFSSSAQSLTLTANVTSASGTVNQGTVTFTIRDGSNNVVGIPVTSETVSGGNASATFALPAGQAAATYAIQAVYNPAGPFLGSTGTNSLSITSAFVSLTATVAAVSFSQSPQSLNLTASVTSGTTVSGGTVTFTVRDSFNNVVAFPVTSGVVAANSATATLLLPGYQAPGPYTIDAVYTGAGNFSAAVGTGSFFIGPAATTTSASVPVNPGYRASAQTIGIEVVVNSAAAPGGVSGGRPTLFVRNSAGNDVGGLISGGLTEVSGGRAFVLYSLPPALAVGAYNIAVDYPGSGTSGFSGGGPFPGFGNFAPSTGSGSFNIIASNTTVNVAPIAGLSYSSGGQPVTLTATVTSDGESVSGGTVSFTVRDSLNAAIGPSIASPVLSNGQAVVSYPFPASTPAGAYSVEAVYSGSANFNGSSGSGSVLITGQPTSTTVAPVSVSFSAGAQVVNLSASVTAAGTVNQGTVFFTLVNASEFSILASSSIAANVVGGVATASATIPAGQSPGIYYIRANYGGGSNFNSSTGSNTLNISGASTTVTPAAVTATYSRSSQTLTFAATLASGGTVNTGTVNFAANFNGSVVNVTGPVVNGRAEAAFTLPAATAAGSYQYTAAFSGGGAAAVGSGNGTVTVSPATTISSPAVLTSPVSASATVLNLSASLTSPSGAVSAGTVTFSLRDNSNNIIGSAQTSATAPVSTGFASTAWVLPANQPVGTYTIRATYNGTANLNTSTGTSTLTISGTNTVVSVPASSRVFGAAAFSIGLTASVTSSTGPANGGTVSFSITDASNAVIGAPVVSPSLSNGTTAVAYSLPAGLARGVYTVTAAYSGFGSFTAANAVSTLTITPAATSVTVSPLTAAYSPTSRTINVTATTTSTGGSVTGGTMVFNVRDSLNNLVFASPVAGSGPSSGVSTASFNLPGGTLPGTYRVQADYSGSNNFSASTGSSTLSISGLSTVMALTAPSSLPFSPASRLVAFSATVTSSFAVNEGAVQFTLRNAGNNIIGVTTGSGTVANGAAAVSFSLPAATPPGVYTLQAVYLGASVFGPSSANLPLVITGGSTTTTLSAPVSPITLGASVPLTASVAPSDASGRVTFFDGALVLGSATLSGGSATLNTRLLPAGTRRLRAVYAGDATYSGSNSPTQARVVAAGLAGALAKAAGSPFATDDGLNASVAGDFNGDGFTDLAAVSWRGLRILFGNGSGGVSSTVSLGGNGAFFEAVAAGDFNADGRLDIAVCGLNSSNTITVFRNDGNNSFVPLTFNSGNGGSGIAFGDFNGDGLLDLVSANRYSNRLTLLRNNGAGSFTPFPNPPGVGPEPTALVVSDFNNDNRADIAVANSGSNTVSVLIGIGDGSFASAALTAGATPVALVAADVDGDGNTDLVAANNGSGNLSLFLNGGNANFGAANTIATLRQPRALSAGDFNGDGKLDLAYSTGGGITTLTGSGTGTFSPRDTIPASTNVSSLVALEFNRDGLTDIAYTTNDVVAGSGLDLLLGGPAATITAVSAASTSFSVATRSLTLIASVTSNSGPVNGGIFTFTVRNGSNIVVGSPVTSGAITAGTASALFTVPASQAAGTYTVTASFSGSDTFSPSTGSNTLLISSPSTFVVTSNPVGLTIVVDGTPVTTPATFTNWGAPGTLHTLAASNNPGTPGTRYVFASWSQGGTASQTLSTPSSSTTYTATFTTQHQFTGNVAGPGSLLPASGWVNAGTVLSVSATPNAAAVFTGFAGDLSGTTNPQNLTISAPRTVTASFSAGSPILGATIQSKGNGTLTNERIWTLRLSNTGTAPAPNVRIMSAAVSYASGTGPVTIITPFPVTVGALANGASTAVPLRLVFPVTLPATRINLVLTLSPNGGATTQAVTIGNQFR